MKRVLVVVDDDSMLEDLAEFEVAVSADGFAYFMSLKNRQDYLGVVTVDVAKQYTVSDVKVMVEALQADPSKIYLGYQPDQSIGRRTFSMTFWFIHSRRIHDARSGLLAFPTEILEGLKRHDYALHVLISAVRNKSEIEEIHLESSLGASRSRSTWRDLFVLFQTFFKYLMSSFSSFLVDIGLFQLMIFLLGHLDSDLRILLATVVSRVVSSVVNYSINKYLVFQNQDSHRMPALKYFGLVLAEMLTSAFLVAVLYRLTGFPETPIKLLVDLVLFFTGYIIEKVFIFEKNK
ncbi:GtrA family protein [Jeotgalibaca sp. A122]|uniref:GtrA family protein n=1 Tax=Jeotgalibaca sp. A122 TaxID=3457322 RepID=UPI003FD35E58